MDVPKSKVVLLGQSTVGKTSFASRVKHDWFHQVVESTIGCEFFGCDYTKDDFECKFLIWDTAGAENFQTFTPQFCRNAHIALVFYDLTDVSTANSLDKWIKFLDSNDPEGKQCEVIIVPTKVDLWNKEEKPPIVIVSAEKRVVHIADPISSKTNEGILALLNRMADIITAKRKIVPKLTPTVVKISSEKKNKEDCCRA